MKLYDVPRNSKILVDPYGIMDFQHIDGMYSYCVDKHGIVHHLAAWTEVDVIQEGTCQPSHTKQ